jgi:hypothetical protein
VQAGRNQFLAGAAFADDQYRFVQRRQPGNLFLHLQETGGFADHPVGLAVG